MANIKSKKRQISTAKSRAAQPDDAPQTIPLKQIDQVEVDIMDALSKLEPDEQTSVLNRVIRNIAIGNFERAQNSRSENDRRNEILRNFVNYHPTADKFIKEHIEKQQNTTTGKA